MLQSGKNFEGMKIAAIDGEIGRFDEFYFDDFYWQIRYLVVDTGGRIAHHRVLISPASVEEVNWEAGQLVVNLRKQQVEDSPDVDTEKPVSREMESELSKYFGWPAYWAHGAFLPEFRRPAPGCPEPAYSVDLPVERTGGPNLRSSKEVIGYHVETTGGELGYVEDFIFDDSDWLIRYMKVDTGNWLPGKQVLVAPQWIERIRWADKKVHIGLTRHKIEAAPDLDLTFPLSSDFEPILSKFYGRPEYWTDDRAR